jgi:hypothetical protein
MRSTARPVLLAVVGSALLLAALWRPGTAAAGCGEEFHQAPAQSSVPGGPPLAIGDSVLADAVPLLARDGFEADGMVCRQMSQGVAMLEARGERLPHLVVLALGTNGEVTPQQIDRVLTLLGPSRILALVTPHGSVVASTPEIIRTAAAANPGRILLLDWDVLAREHPEWLAPDGVHLGGTAGIEGFAQMVASTLPYAAPSSREASEPQEPNGQPETIAPPPQHHSSAPHRVQPKPKPRPKPKPKPIKRAAVTLTWRPFVAPLGHWSRRRTCGARRRVAGKVQGPRSLLSLPWRRPRRKASGWRSARRHYESSLERRRHDNVCTG